MENTLEELQNSLRVASAEVVTLLRSAPDLHALTGGGDWTVRDTAVHLIAVVRLYTGSIEGRPFPITAAEAGAWNAGAFCGLVEDRPDVLADLYDRAVASYIAATVEHSGDDPCPYYAELGGQSTVGMLTAMVTFEGLLHGFDMASAVDRQWSPPESAADGVLANLAPLFLPFLFSADAAGDLNASFTVASPAGRLPYRVHSGGLEPLDESADTDCSISGASSQWLLWIGGRTDWEHAELAAAGQQPDLAPRFAASFPIRNI